MPASFHLAGYQWALAIFGALLIGLAKTGIPGSGIFAISIFALIFPASDSTGIVLPLLVVADIVAVAAYRRHVVWHHLWRLVPWASLGVFLGYLAMAHLKDYAMSKMIGAIFVTMVVLHFWRKKRLEKVGDGEADTLPHTLAFVVTMGVLAGFITMIANAAGPIMILYLLAIGLPKMEFFGTGAWYYLLLNSFKLPFSYDRGLITHDTLALNAFLAIFVISGALFGKAVLPYINQKLFESTTLALTLLAGAKLLFS